jgi:hypothetical protein
VETDPTRTCQLLVGLADFVVLGVDACAGGACGMSAGLAAGLSGLRDPGLGQAAAGGAPDWYCRCSGVRRWRPGTRVAVLS